jgi:hypothetical protein
MPAGEAPSQPAASHCVLRAACCVLHVVLRESRISANWQNASS